MERVIQKENKKWAIEAAPGCISRTTWDTEEEAQKALEEMKNPRRRRR